MLIRKLAVLSQHGGLFTFLFKNPIVFADAPSLLAHPYIKIQKLLRSARGFSRKASRIVSLQTVSLRTVSPRVLPLGDPCGEADEQVEVIGLDLRLVRRLVAHGRAAPLATVRDHKPLLRVGLASDRSEQPSAGICAIAR